MLTQALGLYLATPHQWRFVLVISCALSVVQFFLSPLITESPVYLGHQGLPAEQHDVAGRLWDAGGTQVVATTVLFSYLIMCSRFDS